MIGQALVESDHLPDLKTQVIGELWLRDLELTARRVLHADRRSDDPAVSTAMWFSRDSYVKQVLGLHTSGWTESLPRRLDERLNVGSSKLHGGRAGHAAPVPDDSCSG